MSEDTKQVQSGDEIAREVRTLVTQFQAQLAARGHQATLLLVNHKDGGTTGSSPVRVNDALDEMAYLALAHPTPQTRDDETLGRCAALTHAVLDVRELVLAVRTRSGVVHVCESPRSTTLLSDLARRQAVRPTTDGDTTGKVVADLI